MAAIVLFYLLTQLPRNITVQILSNKGGLVANWFGKFSDPTVSPLPPLSRLYSSYHIHSIKSPRQRLYAHNMDGNNVDVKEIAGGDRISSSNDVSNDLVDTVSSNKNTTLTIKQQCGKQLSNITDLVNDNLIVVRYATFSTVLLLGAYGIANTPLFYRYKHVMDIPISNFTKRKYLHGRIVGVVERSCGIGRSSSNISSSSSNNGVASLLSSSLQRDKISSDSNRDKESKNASEDVQRHPIVLLFRHSSPMERLLSKSTMEKVLKVTGQSTTTGLLYSSANLNRNLLPIELAGLISPPFTQSPSILSSSLTGSSSSNTFTLIDELIQQKTKISIQLLAQRVAAEPKRNNKKEDGDRHIDDDKIQNTAICHLLYKQPKQYFWQTSIAGLEMVQRGEAWTSGVVVPLSNIEDDIGSSENKPKTKESTTTIDYHPTVKQLQNDTKYISHLEEAEYKAWQSKNGMWSSKHVREIRKEYIEYEEEEKNKWSVLSLLKRGFDFVRRR